eukprot:TRINITY_DN2561_c0_g1_i2.p1 TRINITY_DN2561_c0_g1~~TRINITY_DN2561_c0_g1_i2.p1  ORF type:complete len:434 (-),score=88.53 TRINITY_DN2561_c0_g1_i2:170-1471(-)
MTVNYGSVEELYEKKIKQLGPDPLREDADPQRFWEKVQKSKQPIGRILMDQPSIAGLGNIYRAEVLFRCGVHPEQPGNTINKAVCDKLWRESVWCLQRGFKMGSILTVTPGENLGRPWTRRYVYNHKQCGRCGSNIQSWDIATRRVYACLTCQPLHEAELEESRKQALAEAGVPLLFSSKCAPDEQDNESLEKLTVKQLKDKLQQAGLPKNGQKVDLIRRLSQSSQQSDSSEELDDLGFDMNMIDVVPGTEQLGDVATAKQAALEKVQAGENRAVEHIALIVDEDLETKKGGGSSSKKRRRTNGYIEVVVVEQIDEVQDLENVNYAQDKTSTSNNNKQEEGNEETYEPAQKRRSSRQRRGSQGHRRGDGESDEKHRRSKKVADILKPHKMRVAELRQYLSEMGLPTEGKKEDLVERVKDAIWGDTPGNKDGLN